MTSSRLPGKVLMPVAGVPMLVQQLRRLQRCRSLDEIVVATTANHTDDPVVALAEAEGVRWYRGDEHDVLSRYLGAARESRADVVVRSTADCPLIDPEVVDRVIERLVERAPVVDYVSNVVRRSYPQGLDVEAMFTDVLERTGRMARSSPAREHVTYFILRERPELFVTENVAAESDDSDLRWTVDTSEDLALVRRLYQVLDAEGGAMSLDAMVRYCREHGLGLHAPTPNHPTPRHAS